MFFINGIFLIVLTAITALMALFMWRHLPVAARWLCINVWVNLVFDSIDFFVTSNHSVYYHHTFFLSDLITQCLFFNYCTAGMTQKKIGIKAMIVGIAIWVLSLLRFHDTHDIINVPSYLTSVQCIINILLALTAIFYMVRSNSGSRFFSSPVALFITAMLFCWATTYFFWAFQNQLQAHTQPYHFAIIFMLIMNDVYYVLLIVGYYKIGKQKTNTTQQSNQKP